MSSGASVYVPIKNNLREALKYFTGKSRNLAQKDVGGRVHRFGGCRTDGHLQKPSEFLDDPLHDAVVVQDVDEEAEKEDDRQNL